LVDLSRGDPARKSRKFLFAEVTVILQLFSLKNIRQFLIVCYETSRSGCGGRSFIRTAISVTKPLCQLQNSNLFRETITTILQIGLDNIECGYHTIQKSSSELIQGRDQPPKDRFRSCRIMKLVLKIWWIWTCACVQNLNRSVCRCARLWTRPFRHRPLILAIGSIASVNCLEGKWRAWKS
jgi:hypothetical protein